MQYLLAVIFLIFAYYLWTYSKKESFTSGNTPKDMLKKIQGMNIELIDTLNTSSYREPYETMLQELQTWCDHERLYLLTQKITLKSAENFNELTMFKKNLCDFVESVDKMD
jgi:hypothetical protein